MEKGCPGFKGQPVAYPRYPGEPTFHTFPLSAKNDQHQISPCNINAL